MNLSTVFISKEEVDTITHLHNINEAQEILSVPLDDLVNVVTYREGPNKALQLCARQLNSFMRENYSQFIVNVGRNIYPLILASDFEPGFEGVGSTFTLFLKDGSQYKIAPTVNTKYEVYKAISHVALAIFILLSPHLKHPGNIQWRSKLCQLKDNVVVCQDAAMHCEYDEAFRTQILSLIEIYLTFIEECLSTSTFSLDSLLTFTSLAFDKIRVNMSQATITQAQAILPAMLKWKKFLGPTEWSKVYVVIPTVWPVALNSPRLQLFERIIDADKIHTHIITSEYPRSIDEARNVVGRVVGDRSVGRLVFGTADTKAKMKVLALSSRTDVVADDFEIALNDCIAQLDPEDRLLINKLDTMDLVKSNKNESACPMHARASPDQRIDGISERNQPEGSLSAIRHVRLVDLEGMHDILLDTQGMITDIIPSSSVYPSLSSAPSLPTNELEGGGRMCIPGLVDAHVHLDKCYLNSRCCMDKGDFTEAMTETLKAKKNFTVADVTERASRLIEAEISYGTTLLRTHVEVDTIVGLISLEAIIPLRQRYASAITIQICVFAQEGITNMPGQMELMRKALALGCDCVGSAPYVDPQPENNIAAIFDLAKEFNLPVDFHLDYHLEGRPSMMEEVIRQTQARQWQGRVVLGHMTRLSSLNGVKLSEVAAQLAEADIAVLALPASDMCMMGRSDDGGKRRGVCPVNTLQSLGVKAAFATNNVQNPFTFSGDGDVLRVCTLLCQVLQLTSTSTARLALAMASTSAARCIGVQHDIAPGLPADLLLLPAASALQIVGAPPEDRTVLKRGRVVAITTRTTITHY